MIWRLRIIRRNSRPAQQQTIDADATAGGDQAFTFIGGGAFTSTAGELHYIGQFLEGDVDGNGTADFRIQLNVWSLANTDFILQVGNAADASPYSRAAVPSPLMSRSGTLLW